MSIFHGVSCSPAPWDMTALDAFEADAGKTVAIIHYFIGFTDMNPPEQNILDDIQARNAAPMITWQWSGIASLAEVIDGTHDPTIHLWATELLAHGGPVLLRWGHEMNLPNYDWSIGVNGNTAADYIDAWRHIKDIFTAEGATNVLFVWCPGVIGYGSDFTPMYPGDAYVDWVGMDGYNWATLNPWMTFTEVFTQNASYATMTGLTSKPLMIGEYSCTEFGGDKGAWFLSALGTEIPADFPAIQALVLFNENFEEDWRIESSPGATAGYAAGIADALYVGVWSDSPPPPPPPPPVIPPTPPISVFPTLQKLIEEETAKKAIVRVIIGGTELPIVTSVTYQFEIGQVPTAQVTVPGLTNLPSAVQEEAAVQIWFGYKAGLVYLERLVFGGAVVDSVGNNGSDIVITCVMDGPRKLSYSYNRRIAFDFDSVTAVESVTALLDLAGVINYAVNLDPWLIGTAVPYTAALHNQLQFSSYGDAVNKVAEVDGSPWYALPTGMVRVEKRDPIPSATFRRSYFTSVLTGPVETQPVGISNPLARPLINDISKNKNRRDVANFIEVDGAVLVTFGPNGEQNSNQIVETVDGISGQFPNGAYWIPTPPLFQDFNFSNELIDTDAKSFEVAERYFDLKNRLFEDLPITVPGDPDVFLGETVQVKDVVYSGTSSLYFVKGYSTTIDQNSCTTQLSLTGGPESGTIGFAAPFAEFYWIYVPLITPGGGGNPIDLGPGAQPAAKLCEDMPEDTVPPDQTEDPTTPQKAMVYIGLDGTASQDFDGYIVSYDWEWTDSLDIVHNLSGPRWTIVVDPSTQGSITVKLTVTDNSGRTDSITKNINTNVNISIPPNPPTSNPNLNDTPNGGGVGAGPCTDPPEFPNPYGPNDPGPGGCTGLELSYFVAAKAYAMGSKDNESWNDLSKAAAGVTGDFISVDCAVNNITQSNNGIFGTSQGEVVKTIDNCATGSVVFSVPGSPEILCVHFDTVEMGNSGGEIPPPGTNPGDIPVYTESSPGTLTIVQAYQQCRAVGFDNTPAIIAVAIMVRESGLYSHAFNNVGNTPPSNDRGIAQWNDFYHPDISDACAYNTQCAITEMFKKSSGGSDFSPWNVSGPGTYLHGTNLSAVQAAVSGLSGNAISVQQDANQVVPAGLKVWLGTSDGRVYMSGDSGDTWELWVDFADGYPINAIGTPPRYGAQTSSLWVFGGDTGKPDTLVRIDAATDKNFTPLSIQGDLLAAIQAAGPGRSCNSSMNATSSIIFFSGGVAAGAWTSQDPLGDPASWVPVNGLGEYPKAAAPGYDGEYVMAGIDSYSTTDNQNFTDEGVNPSPINHMLWRGLPGMYAAAADGGLYTTVDFGDNWGALRPNAAFNNTWPAGSVGYQVAIGLGARVCIPVTTDTDCIGGIAGSVYVWFDMIGQTPAGKLYQLDNTGIWLARASIGTDPEFESISSADSGEVWSCEQGGTQVYISQDRGISFDTRSTPDSGSPNALAKDIDGNYWLQSDGGSGFSISTNNGVSWTSMDPSGGSAGLGSIATHLSNSQKVAVAWISGGNVNVSVSEDQGATWATTVIDTGTRVYLVWVGERVVVVYLKGNAIKSVFSDDYGATWSAPITAGTETNISGLSLAKNDNTIFVVPNYSDDIDKSVLFRSNSGSSWTTLANPNPGGWEGTSSNDGAATFQAKESLLVCYRTASTNEIWRLSDAATVTAGNEAWERIPMATVPGLPDGAIPYAITSSSSVCFEAPDVFALVFDTPATFLYSKVGGAWVAGNQICTDFCQVGFLVISNDHQTIAVMPTGSEPNGFISIDGGSSFGLISTPPSNIDNFLNFSIDKIKRLWALAVDNSSFGVVLLSSDNGASWSEVYAPGSDGNVSTSLSPHPVNGAAAAHAWTTLITSGDVNVAVTSDSGSTWNSVAVFTAGELPEDTFHQYSGYLEWVGERLVLVVSNQRVIAVKHSEDGGVTWSPVIIVNDYGSATIGPAAIYKAGDSIFILPVNNSGSLLLFRSQDEGDTWETITADAGTSGNGGFDGYYDPSNDRFYVLFDIAGSDSQHLWYLNNATQVAPGNEIWTEDTSWPQDGMGNLFGFSLAASNQMQAPIE